MERIERAHAPIISALERQRAVVAEIQRLEGKDLPAPILDQILTALLAVANHVERQIRRYQSDLREYDRDVALHAQMGGDKPVPLSPNELRSAVKPLVVLHEVFEVFDKADSSRIPFELVTAFQQFSTDLFGEEVSFVFKPARSYNYSVLDVLKVFSKPGLVWESFAAVRPRPFLVLFPSAEASSALLHTLLYHEIGHPYYALRLKKPMAAIEHPRGVDRALRDALSSWVEEVCCDLVALRLVGPAFLCAFQFFGDPFLAESEASHTHPGFRTRWRIMAAYMDRLGKKQPELAAACDMFFDYCSPPDVEDRCPPALRPISEIVDDPTSPLWQQAFDLVDACASPFEREGITAAIKVAAEQIGLGVPPVIRPLPPEWEVRDILAVAFCSAWLFRIAHMGTWTAPPPTGLGWSQERAERALSEILLAGVEAAELELRHRKWQRRR